MVSKWRKTWIYFFFIIVVLWNIKLVPRIWEAASLIYSRRINRRTQILDIRVRYLQVKMRLCVWKVICKARPWLDQDFLTLRCSHIRMGVWGHLDPRFPHSEGKPPGAAFPQEQQGQIFCCFKWDLDKCTWRLHENIAPDIRGPCTWPFS